MESLLMYFAVLNFSFNAFALKVKERPTVNQIDQSSSLVKKALKQENSPETFLANPVVTSHTIPQASNEEPTEFLTALGVYLIIIIVYSVYGFKINAKNIRD
jgi:hypothetical protein